MNSIIKSPVGGYVLDLSRWGITLIIMTLSVALLLLPSLFFVEKLSGGGIGITVLEGENVMITVMIITSVIAITIYNFLFMHLTLRQNSASPNI